MPNRLAKRAILSALRQEPDFSALALLSSWNGTAGRSLLEWLDHSGLTLIFLDRLRVNDKVSLIPVDLRMALEQRLAKNTERLRDMLKEFQRLTDAFREHGVFAATLKGFTLFPDFCGALSLRHQTDFDFLVDPENVEAAADALQSCGYSTAYLCKSGESCFTTPLHYVPSRRDDLYSLQRHRQVDLHTSICENSPWLTVNVPDNSLELAEPEAIQHVQFYALSLEDKFLTQVLHVFRHSFRSWTRLSWVLEIARCMEIHRKDEPLWQRVIERAGEDPLTRCIFAFVLGLTNRLFVCCIPSTLLSWSSEATSRSMCTWLDHFSVDWAISDWPGSLNNLFMTQEFIPDRKRRLQYLGSRLLPKRGQTTIGELATVEGTSCWKANSVRLRYVADRSAAHLKNLLCLPWQYFRWWKALMMARTSRIGVES
jgi:hypothetical protein